MACQSSPGRVPANRPSGAQVSSSSSDDSGSGHSSPCACNSLRSWRLIASSSAGPCVPLTCSLIGMPRLGVGYRGSGLLTGGVHVVVFVVTAHPHLGRMPLVAAERSAVEQAVVAHHELEPTGGRRVGQVDGSVLKRIGTHHRRLGEVCRWLGPALLREPGGYRGDAACQELARRLLRTGDLEVEVVVASV